LGHKAAEKIFKPFKGNIEGKKKFVSRPKAAFCVGQEASKKRRGMD